MSAAFEEFLEEVYATTGRLEADQIYELVKDPNHPMHNELEWDQEVCQREWVLHQIDRKVRMVKMRTIDRRTGEARRVRYWVAQRQAGGLDGWKPTQQVMADPLQAKILFSEIVRARAELTRKIQSLLSIADDTIRQQLMDEYGDLL
jgi:hypothetical protein